MTSAGPAVALLVLALSAPAAVAAQGDATIRLGGSAARALTAQGVTIAPVAPARSVAAGLRLPVTGGALGATSTLRHGGALRLRRGGRTVTLTALRTTTGARARISGLVGGRRVALLAADEARPARDEAAFRLRVPAAALRLTPEGARAIARPLGLARVASGRLGTLRVDATLPPPEPARPARPAGAVDLTGATVTWHVRDSFVQYINGGEGTRATDGAVAAERSVAPGSDVPLVYEFGFAFRDGWLDPATGAAAVRFRGRVRFAWKAHGIDLVAADPELELVPGAARAVMRFGGASSPANRRAVLVTLAPGAPQADADGSRRWSQLPGTLPAGVTSSVFAGYYLAGEPFGWFGLRVVPAG